MDRSQIVGGLERLHAKVNAAEGLLKSNKLDSGQTKLEAIVMDVKYFLKHLKALIKKGKKPKSLPFTGIAKRKTKAKTTLKRKPTKRKRTVRKRKV